ncbi:MAG: hypothetical protein NTV88_01825 [Candidatus Micrarchaeota archaeon]|nr:hypothetical protein [Candidatus Micrarchaeota archaeon]
MMPCSEVHWKILPSVSREIALCLEKAKMPRGKIAAALGTTPAAISQYMSGKRGGMKLKKEAKDACCRLAKRIDEGELKGTELNAEIARVVVIAKGSKLGENDPCAICMSYTEEL